MELKNLKKDFMKYVSLNILGMIGFSCYILADTLFISKASGTLGLAALNLSLPMISFVLAVGLMLGIGGATKYKILNSKENNADADSIFTVSCLIGALCGIIFSLIGIFLIQALARLLGANGNTLQLTITYLRIILVFAPFFVLNNVLVTFVRNDNDPKLSMNAMLISSFSNIVLDYIFMFPLNMGMMGAALATGLSPVISLIVLSSHFLSNNNTLKIHRTKIYFKSVVNIVSLGISAFITEMSSAIVLISFNLVILKIEGNTGVAAYGVVANIAIVATAIFNGIAQGIQPLASREYGMKNKFMVNKILIYSLITSFSLALILYIIIFYYSDSIILLFNSENDLHLARLAKVGLRIYFLGFFFSGFNIIAAAFLSAIEKASRAFFISILRGFIVIIPAVIIFSTILKMNGVWISFLVTEFIVSIVTFLFLAKKHE